MCANTLTVVYSGGLSGSPKAPNRTKKGGFNQSAVGLQRRSIFVVAGRD